MDVGAALSALTVLLAPVAARTITAASFAKPMAPLLREATNPSIEVFWASSIRVDIEGTDPAASSATEGAIETWNDRIGADALDLSNSEPNLEVVFVPDLRDAGSPVAGLTSWSRDWRGELHATVQLRTQLPNGRPMPKNALRQAALHEFGHVLGLEDNPQPNCVMGNLDIRHPVLEPNECEVEAIQRLRALSVYSTTL